MPLTPVTVVIPTLAADATFLHALESLRRQSYREFQAVVVDNGGKGEVRRAGAEGLGARVVEPGSNLGYGAAINAAFRRFPAPLLATLNDDATADREWLAAMVAAIEAGPRIGMCAAQVRLAGTHLLDSAGMLIARDGSSRQRGHYRPAARYSEAEPVLLPSGSAALYRGRMLEEIGLFDEDFFLYCEDTDLGLRARRAGWECVYVPAAVVEHRYSYSAGRASKLKAYYVERNRLATVAKNFPGRLLWLVPLASLARYCFHLLHLVRGRGKAAEFRRAGASGWLLAWYVIKAHLWAVANARRLWRKRREVSARAKLRPAGFCALLEAYRISLREVASL